MDVGIHGLRAAAGDCAGDGTATDFQFTGNYPDGNTRLTCYRDLFRLNVPVAGGLHFFSGWQVEPELESPHDPGFLLRHLRVHDAPACGHPLHPTVAEVAAIPQVVLMQHVAFNHIGDGFKAPVRMGRKAGNIVLGLVRTEFIQHQEWIHAHGLALTQ